MKRVGLFFAGWSLIILCGCETYVSSLKRTFRQAAVVCEEDLASARSWIRDEPVYDYFNTINTVSVLWDVPEVQAVRNALLNVSDNTGSVPSKDGEQRFIVLMDGDKEDWSFALHCGNVTVVPEVYRPYDLDGASKTIFGSRRMRFKKNVYELVFPVSGVEYPCRLECSNTRYRVAFIWEKGADVA